MKLTKKHIWFFVLNAFLVILLMYFIWAFDFKNPAWLFALLTTPALLAYYYYKEDYYFGELKLGSSVGLTGNPVYNVLPVLIKLLPVLAFFLGTIALARPQQEEAPKDISKEGIDIIISMDVSSSMLSKDFDPDRLEASKQVAKEFVMDRVNDRIGIVVYAAESFPKVPLTSDLSMVVNAIDEIQFGELIDGTAIGMGLASSVNRLKDSESKSKAVILLSDGTDNSKANRGQIPPLDAAELAKAYGVTVYTIGVGSVGTALSPASRDHLGNIRFSEQEVKIDERTLFEIADHTGGKYFRATSQEKLAEIYKEIDKLEKTRFESTIIKNKADIYYKFLGASLLLLILSFVLQKLFFKSIFS